MPTQDAHGYYLQRKAASEAASQARAQSGPVIVTKPRKPTQTLDELRALGIPCGHGTPYTEDYDSRA